MLYYTAFQKYKSNNSNMEINKQINISNNSIMIKCFSQVNFILIFRLYFFFFCFTKLKFLRKL